VKLGIAARLAGTLGCGAGLWLISPAQIEEAWCGVVADKTALRVAASDWKRKPSGGTEAEEDGSSDEEKCSTVEKEDPAIAACTRLLDARNLSRRDKARYLSNRGAAYLNQDKYDLALEDLNESLRLDPNDPLYIYNRGATYFYMKEYDKALSDLKRSHQLDASSPKTEHYLGRTYYELGRLDEAITYLGKAIALEPDDEYHYRHRADVYLDKGDYDKAIADYDDAIRIDPKYAEAYRGRGICYRDQENTARAIDDLSDAIHYGPDDWYALYLRGGAHVMDKRYAEAIDDFTAALRLDSGNTRVLNGRADAQLKAGQPALGLPDVDDALSREPEFAVAITTRGEIFEALDRKDEAIAEFKRALEIDDTIDDARAGLSRLDPSNPLAASASATTGEDTGGSNSCTKFLASVGKTVPAPCDKSR
jgi:tetratricopeptide (TPR) repeat protein